MIFERSRQYVEKLHQIRHAIISTDLNNLILVKEYFHTNDLNLKKNANLKIIEKSKKYQYETNNRKKTKTSGDQKIDLDFPSSFKVFFYE